MKRNDSALLIAVSFYSFLFYRQSPGINFVIFNLVLLGCLALINRQETKSKQFLIAALGCLASALCVGYYGNLLSVIANIISLSLLSSISINKNSSVVVSLISSASSYFASPVNMVLDYQEKYKVRNETHPNSWKRIILIGIPVVITFVFFFLYRASNPLFDKLAEKINLDFISMSWIIFTFIGLVLLYGFFYQRKLESLSKWDEQSSKIENKEYKTLRLFGKDLNLTDENFSGIVLFVLLNLLVLIVNIGDIDFLAVTKKLPEGISYSQFVHQGIDALIASIIIAIAIVLFYFRGGLNFFAKNKAIRVLACIWILQNAFMIYSTACRNTLYIAECGLTFKRIGVYVYLLLALTGLVTTFIKIIKAKSNSFLFRVNGWVFYSFLVIFSFPNWDRIVTSYNVKNNKMDYPEYMFSLSNSNIPDLLPFYNASLHSSQIDIYRNPRKWGIEKAFSQKLYNFIALHDTLDWRSWYYDNTDTYNAITKNEFVDSVTDIDLSGVRDLSLKHLSILTKITGLSLSYAGLTNIDELPTFTSLRELDLSSNCLANIKAIGKCSNLRKLNLAYSGLKSLNGIEALQKLEDLNLYNDNIQDISVLSKLPNLKTLTISTYFGNDNLLSILHGLQNLRKLDISGNNMTSLSGVENLQQLEELDLGANAIIDYSPLYKLPHLKTVSIPRSSIRDSTFTILSRDLPNVKIIEL
ncbi:MAG TPA: DUF4153 domain-containing protein [Bacteroidia bacterium]|nr:DUF4153 domain-containing protein [Bacteroidia bacterium]